MTADRPQTPHEWAQHIRGHFAKAVEGAVGAGQGLIDAKGALAHGEYETMVVDELRMSTGTARKLAAIASNRVIADRSHENALPPAWTTLYALSQMEPDDLAAAIEQGDVWPTMERRHAEDVVELYREQPADPQPESEVLDESTGDGATSPPAELDDDGAEDPEPAPAAPSLPARSDRLAVTMQAVEVLSDPDIRLAARTLIKDSEAARMREQAASIRHWAEEVESAAAGRAFGLAS
jgi:hypothetical protein